MKRVLHTNRCNMKRVRYEKSAIWKEFNMKKVQHGNMKRAQNEKSVTWKNAPRNERNTKKL